MESMRSFGMVSTPVLSFFFFFFQLLIAHSFLAQELSMAQDMELERSQGEDEIETKT
jgi:hypothetical protein